MRTRSKRRTYEELQKIFKAIVVGYSKGILVKDIAKGLGVDEKCVINYAYSLRKAGIDLPKSTRKPERKAKQALKDFVREYKKMKKVTQESTPVQLSLFGEVPNVVRKIEVQSVID